MMNLSVVAFFWLSPPPHPPISTQYTKDRVKWHKPQWKDLKESSRSLCAVHKADVADSGRGGGDHHVGKLNLCLLSLQLGVVQGFFF